MLMANSEAIDKIKKYMKKHNLMQWQLAEKLDIPPETLNRWLRGKVNISRAYLQILMMEKVI